MIRFSVRPSWQEATVASRLAEILGVQNAWNDNPDQPPFNQDGKWQLDCSNDWWMEKIGKDKYELRYRYDNENTEEALKGLQKFLIWQFS